MKFLGKDVHISMPPYFIAEISCNHGGNIEYAKDLILAAKQAHADCAKIQLYTPDEMCLFGPKCKSGPWKNQTLTELYSEARTPREWIPELFEYAGLINFPLFASVFGKHGLELLEKNNCPAYKIASFEANDPEFVRMVVSTGKPVVISISNFMSMDEFTRTMNELNYNNCIVMHCVNNYPTAESDANLWRIDMLHHFCGLTIPIGFSDHTQTIRAAQAAVAMGASVIEKHLSLPIIKTPDKEFSISKTAFSSMVFECNRTKSMIVNTCNTMENTFNDYKRSLWVIQDIVEHEPFSYMNVKSLRPGDGLDPGMLSKLLYMHATQDIKAGTPLTMEMIK